MIINTDYLGEIEYEEKEILTFEDGLYGFEDYHRFIVVDPKDEEFPFMWLQSLDEESLSFILTQPFLFSQSYEFKLAQADINALGLESEEDAATYAIAVIKENVVDSTINLKSPIIINVKNKKARQIILEENYPFKFEIFK